MANVFFHRVKIFSNIRMIQIDTDNPYVYHERGLFDINLYRTITNQEITLINID